MLAEVPDPECIILNGDLIDGNQWREKGRGLVTPNLTWQSEACLDILDTLPKVPMYFTQGTGYHELADGLPVEEHLAKEMGGEFGDDLIIDECGIRMQVGHTISSSSSSWQYWCYSDDTEVLTPFGWKKHTEVLTGECIATYFPHIERFMFKPPSDLFCKHYCGPMVHFLNEKNCSVLVTPSHKMWVKDHSKFVFKFAENIKNRADILLSAPLMRGVDEINFDPVRLPNATQEYIGHTPKNEEVDIDICDWAEFIGFYLSEGGRQREPDNKKYRVTFAQKDPETSKIMEDCFKKIGIPFSKQDNSYKYSCQSWHFGRKQLWQALGEFGSGSDEKRIPSYIFSYPKQALKRLFNALILGDGSFDPRNGKPCEYYTTSLQLANDVQRLATLLGHAARVSFHYAPKEEHHKTGYRVHIRSTPVGTVHPEICFYSGNVVCFSTESGLYLTRRPGCYPTIQGNTTAIARDLLLLALHNAEEKYGKVDVAIRSHRHNFCGAIFKSQIGVITPCWQTRTPFAVKKDLVSPPDIGYVVLHVGPGKNIMIDRSGIIHSPTPPARIVGRDRK